MAEKFKIVDFGDHLAALSPFESRFDGEISLCLSLEECSKIRALMLKEFVNQNEEPGKSAYPILKAIMEFGNGS